MGLIDLKTDLTSLRYGSDTKGGGESRSAKFMNNIYSPETTGVDQIFADPSSNPQSSGDFVLRGGVLYPDRVADDFKRVGNFMTSWKGVGFIAKQNLLERQQAKVPRGQQPTRIYSPLTTLLEVAGGSNSMGLHLDGKGLNPFIGERSKYLDYTLRNDDDGLLNQNRLKQLYKSKIQKNPVRLSKYGVTGDIQTTTLLQYSGGPNAAIPGVSNSTYQRVSNTTLNGLNFYDPNPNIDNGVQLDSYKKVVIDGEMNSADYETNRLLKLFTSKIIQKPIDSGWYISDDFNQILSFPINPDGLFPGVVNPNTSTPQNIQYRATNTTYKQQLYDTLQTVDTARYVTMNQSDLQKQDQSIDSTQVTDFREDIKKNNEVYSPKSPAGKQLQSTNYKEFNRRRTYGEGDPGKRNFDRSDPYGEGFQTGWEDTVDKVNYQRLYAGATANEDVSNLDIIPFYITVLDNDVSSDNVHIHFRAFIDSFSDSYNSEWASHKFMGRGENFYTYKGFGREISLGFKVHAQSKPELKAMYSKLNYLASSLAPDYNTPKGGFMRGNLVKLTMGDYLTDVIGFISALAFTIPQESVWDIARNADGTKSKTDLVLPHLIDVNTFSFTPIANFLPQKVSSNYIGKQTSKNMNAPFISLKNKEGYENTNPIIPQNAPDPGNEKVDIEEEWDWDESEQEWNWSST